MSVGWQEHLAALPDAAARISRAEAVLCKQVNPNFLKLAVINAEQGRTVPPLAAPFVRLLLLQGVIKLLHARNVGAAISSLKEAHALCSALVVDQDALDELMRLGASEDAAIVALRQSGGNIERAGGEILDRMEARRAADSDRAKQRRLGLTANKQGYLHLKSIDTVSDLLSVKYEVAVALLRLADNDIDKAAHLWHQASRQEHEVLQKAHDISAANPKKKARIAGASEDAKHLKQAQLPPVDELALVQLMSTGVDKELAECALRSTAAAASDPVEAAMDWLFSDAGAAARSAMNSRATGDDALGPKNERAGSQGTSLTSSDVSEGGDRNTSSSSDDFSGKDGEENMESDEDQRHTEAYELFERELGQGLQRLDLAEQHLGLPLRDELALIDKYLALALAQASAGAAGGAAK